MNRLAKWNFSFRKRTPTAQVEEDPQAESCRASALSHLQTRINHWSHLWSGSNESVGGRDAQQVLTERLTPWIEHCFGQHVPGSLRDRGGQISLATSTPIFTAFLGRRATRELYRRVLQDI